MTPQVDESTFPAFTPAPIFFDLAANTQLLRRPPEFCNPAHLPETALVEITYYYPVVAELFDILATGTEELEGQAPLDCFSIRAG